MGPTKIPWNVLCNLLYVHFNGKAGYKIAGSEALEELYVCQLLRQEEEGRGSRLKLQFTSTEPF